MVEGKATRTYHVAYQSGSGWEQTTSIQADTHSGGDAEESLCLMRGAEVVARFEASSIKSWWVEDNPVS